MMKTNIQLNSGSMADIAFLLLIFFLVTTQIPNDQGLMTILPPKMETPPLDVHERNVFSIQVNSADAVMVEGEVVDVEHTDLKKMVMEFILSEEPESTEKAVISIKTDRGSSYDLYIRILDQVQGAYYQLRGDEVGISAEDFRKLDQQQPGDFLLYQKGKKKYPMNISIAEPTGK